MEGPTKLLEIEGRTPMQALEVLKSRLQGNENERHEWRKQVEIAHPC